MGDAVGEMGKNVPRVGGDWRESDCVISAEGVVGDENVGHQNTKRTDTQLGSNKKGWWMWQIRGTYVCIYFCTYRMIRK